jgi:hypothetical protein
LPWGGGNDSVFVLQQHLAEARRELIDVPVRVDPLLLHEPPRILNVDVTRVGEAPLGQSCARASSPSSPNMAESLSLFGIVVGFALLLSGIGFAILVVGGTLRASNRMAWVSFAHGSG